MSYFTATGAVGDWECAAMPGRESGPECPADGRGSTLDCHSSLDLGDNRRTGHRHGHRHAGLGQYTQYGTYICTHCTHRIVRDTMRATLKSKAGCGSRIVYALHAYPTCRV